MMFDCSDCPRKGAKGEVAFESDFALAALAGEDISMTAKSRCLRPDKPMMFACSDCSR
jgi:hypothetical protein